VNAGPPRFATLATLRPAPKTPAIFRCSVAPEPTDLTHTPEALRPGGTSELDIASYFAIGAAAAAAGAANAMAGGGTLICFPTLVALGVPPINANVTNTVSLLPGYASGTLAQREDLTGQRPWAQRLGVFGALGGLGGSVLLIVTPESAFRAAIPWLILLSCALLLAQDRIRTFVTQRRGTEEIGERPGMAACLAVFAAAVYGGYFGAGLGIMLIALLGLFNSEPLVRINALKQLLSFVVNCVAAVFFAFSGHVEWSLVPVMAVAAIVGGTVGGRLSRVVNPTMLRRIIVVAGFGIALTFWLT
jgi:uncharacterized membrane protein YfcA